ncbi:MAG: UDP-2,3-diacylglucosamine diphosphatase [Flavobacteriales bacterium]
MTGLGQNIYLASDFHLGVPNYEESLKREKKIIEWLSSIQSDAKIIFLVGDVWDFWFEYKTAIPKGSVRLLGKLAELTDSGIEIHFFKGNHDMWTFGYLEEELGIKVHSEPQKFTFFDNTYLIGHGDGLGPGDLKYKMLKLLFRSSICQWLLARVHPNVTLGIGNYFSRKSRLANSEGDKVFLKDEEWLYQFCKDYKEPIDYFIFGHRHLPLEMNVEGKSSIYFNLGEWINYFSFMEIKPDVNPKLKFYKSKYKTPINL